METIYRDRFYIDNHTRISIGTQLFRTIYDQLPFKLEKLVIVEICAKIENRFIDQLGFNWMLYDPVIRKDKKKTGVHYLQEETDTHYIIIENSEYFWYVFYHMLVVCYQCERYWDNNYKELTEIHKAQDLGLDPFFLQGSFLANEFCQKYHIELFWDLGFQNTVFSNITKGEDNA